MVHLLIARVLRCYSCLTLPPVLHSSCDSLPEWLWCSPYGCLRAPMAVLMRINFTLNSSERGGVSLHLCNYVRLCMPTYTQPILQMALKRGCRPAAVLRIPKAGQHSLLEGTVTGLQYNIESNIINPSMNDSINCLLVLIKKYFYYLKID